MKSFGKKLYMYLKTYNGCNAIVLSFGLLLLISFWNGYQYAQDVSTKVYYDIMCAIFWSSGVLCFLVTIFSSSKFGAKALIVPVSYILNVVAFLYIMMSTHWLPQNAVMYLIYFVPTHTVIYALGYMSSYEKNSPANTNQ